MAERQNARLRFVALASLGLLILMGGCSRTQGPPKQEGGVTGSDGFTNFNTPLQGANTAPAVNAFLWRASLDTISFMPLASADAYGGVVITDWYSPPESPSERFKVNVFVSGRQLRADALRAVVFRQTRKDDGNWADAPVDAGTARSLEDTILARARQLRAEVPAQ